MFNFLKKLFFKNFNSLEIEGSDVTSPPTPEGYGVMKEGKMTDWNDDFKAEDANFSYFFRGMNVYWDLLGKEKSKVLKIIFFLIFSETLAVSFSFILKLIFDELTTIYEKGIGITFYLYSLIVAIFVSKVVVNLFNRFVLEKNFLKLLIYLENYWPRKMQKKLLDLSLTFHERENTGKKISKIEKGCSRLIDILARLRWGLLPDLIYLVINIIFLIAIDWRLGVLFMLPFFPAGYVNILGWKKYAPYWEEWEKEYEKGSGFFCGSILNIRTVQNFVQEKRETDKFSKIRNNMECLDVKSSLGIQKYLFAMNMIMDVSFIFTILVSIYFLVNGQVTVGTVIFVITTGNITFRSIWNITHEYTEISKRLISVMRMKKLFDEKEIVQDNENAIIPKNYQGKFVFENVKFIYPNKKKAVLDGLNLEMKSEGMVALVGKTGEGKSTIFKLLCRMHDINNGKISLDGVDIRKIDLGWYRKLFAIVQQDVDIFDMSIRDNIAYANENIPENQIIEAIKAAYLGVVLNSKDRFPNGINTEVGERGVRLSGGERQRVGIARAYLALLSGAKVLVLDEATSNLDSQAERAIQEMIENLRKKMPISIIACAHRFSTIQKADEIFVIANGKVSESGNHERLFRKNGLYSELVKLQQLGEIIK